MKLQKKPLKSIDFTQELTEIIDSCEYSKARRKMIRMCNRVSKTGPNNFGHKWKRSLEKVHRPLGEYLRLWHVPKENISFHPKKEKYRIPLNRNRQIPSKFYGYKRLTFKYAPAYRDLDQSEYVGLFHVLSYGQERFYDEEYDSGTYLVRVKCPKGLDQETIENVLSNEMSYSCGCDYDCCGHIIRRMGGIVSRKRNEVLVQMSFSYNI